MEDCSPEALASTQLVAGLCGDNIDDRNRPFIEKGPELIYCAAYVQHVQKTYGIPDSVMQGLGEVYLDFFMLVGNTRVHDPESPPPEEQELE